MDIASTLVEAPTLALGTGADFTTWALAAAGHAFIAIMAVRGVLSYAKSDWGALVTSVVAGVFVAGLVFMPDQSVAMLKSAWTMVLGGT